MIGVLLFWVRKARTICQVFSIVCPLVKERCPAAWIVGPSAIGSEKGMPSSMMSAPTFGSSCIREMEVWRLGSPAMR